MINGEDTIMPIVRLDDDGGWADVLWAAKPHLDKWGMGRLKNALAATAKTVAIERHYIDKDYRDTFFSFHAKKFHTSDARCTRLHFFKTCECFEALANQHSVPNENYLGYSVVRPTRPNCIGRTLLTPKARPSVAGAMCLCSEWVNLQGIEYSVNGFPFISQDGDATVCAHAALWGLIRYFSNRYPLYREVYPAEIATLTRDYSAGRLFPASGLYVWQMAAALRQVGFASVVYDRGEHGEKLESLLYTYIESGIPVLAAFEDHVVVLFGHTSDYSQVSKAIRDKGKPFILSSSFSNGFVGNDDNGIPYQALMHKTQKRLSCDMMGDEFFETKDIVQFVVPLPERVYLAAEEFEHLVTTLLRDARFGYGKLSESLRSKTLILRLFLTAGKAFKTQTFERNDMGAPRVAEVYRMAALPHFIWVCEISTTDHYPHEVLGEVLWDATRNASEEDGLLAVHYPECLVIDEGMTLNGVSDVVKYDIEAGNPYPVYSHNLKEIL